MAEREQDLRQLRRGDLVELMLEQAKQLESVKRELRRRDEELEQCRKELEDARAALGKREIDLDEAGSIAEAALRVNGIFEAVAHDFPKEEARGYIKQVEAFFNAGWDKLLGL